MTSCSLVEVYRRLSEKLLSLLGLLVALFTEDGDSTFHRNTNKYFSDYTGSYLTQSSPFKIIFIPLFVSQAEIICSSSSLYFIYSLIMRKKQCMQLIAEYKWKIHWGLLSAQLGCKPPLPPCEVRICVVASTVPVNLESNIKGTRQPLPLSSLLLQPCLCHCKTPPNHQLRWAASLILHGGSTPKIKQKHLWPFTPPHTFSF